VRWETRFLQGMASHPIPSKGIQSGRTFHCAAVMDCLDLLRALPDGSAQLVVADPPYKQKHASVVSGACGGQGAKPRMVRASAASVLGGPAKTSASE
jgi:hypothetical protein